MVISPSAISVEINWITQRIESLIQKNVSESLPLPVPDANTPYGKMVNQYNLNEADRVLLDLTFVSLYQPVVFAPFILSLGDINKSARFGGVYKEQQNRFFPTVRTAVFLLSGGDEEMAAYYCSYFTSKHILFTSNIVTALPLQEGENFLDHPLYFNDQFIPAILNGDLPVLDGDSGFPAKRGNRTHTMKDVILDEKTAIELQKIYRFARNMKNLWSLPKSSKYRKNYIAVFSGEPGTGKSHTAEAIGNELNLPVYKINFAQLVSKYIGETEKNLDKVFNRFSGQPGILFFDEAESIFSKRTEVKDSHDKHANNEQSFLLQRIEDYSGIVILATNVQNLSQYFDKAFQRRIRQIINFQFPEYSERLKLWENSLGSPFVFEEGLVNKLAKNYQLSGGSIYNVISDGVIEALDRETESITFELLESSLRDEFKKTGRKFEVCTDEMVGHDPSRRFGYGYENRKNF